MASNSNNQADLMPRITRALQRATTQLEEIKRKAHEPIAVIGMACRFPGADTPEAFWSLLQEGKDMVREVPIDRWDVDAYYDPEPGTPGKMYMRSAAFLEQVDQFDPQFFGISPREAMLMDPQHRLLLEVSWEAMERAGYAPAALKQSQTGIYVGISWSDYGSMADEMVKDDPYLSTGTVSCFASGRLSHVLGVQGPNMVVDTACSASLVGIHLACQSLRADECDLALAGGVNLVLAPDGNIGLSQMRALAADGRCKTFDASADGFGRGEGCGMVALKRLSDALADGDTILAVVRGSAVNHDGTSSGLTVPNASAQTALIQHALQNAKVDANEISYIDAHGTGTSLGDPIEVRALASAYQTAHRQTPLYIGSVKTNIGHLEPAAGIAGFMKVVLSLQHQEIPPHLHFQTPNPHIDWERVAMQVPVKRTEWHGDNKMAAVSSFGLGGTNAHLILSDPPTQESSISDSPAQVDERPAHILTLSARNEQGLHDLAARYRDFLTTQSAAEVGNICYTTATGRNHFAHRLSIVGSSTIQMQSRLSEYINGTTQTSNLLTLPLGTSRGDIPEGQTTPKVAFLFTGQGAQYMGMGRDLYETNSIFRSVLDRCEAVAKESLGRSLLDLFYPTETPDHNDLMTSHPCGQAVNFAIECAVANLWRSWGIEPYAVLGHSLGDFAAAYTAGVLSLEDGLRLVIERGRLMETASGRMVSVRASEADVMPLIADYDDVTLGVINGPQSVVISGGDAHVTEIEAQLKEAGFKTRTLEIPVAAHSPMLNPVLDTFEKAVRQLSLSSPQCPVVSSMTGELVTDELTDPRYWRQHLRNTVRFADGVAMLDEQGIDIFIEIGPGATLLGMAGEVINERGETSEEAFSSTTHSPSPVFLPSLRKNERGWVQMLTSLGELYTYGVEIDWTGFDSDYSRQKRLLPTYPFQRQRYWFDVPKKTAAATLRPLIDKMTKLPLHNETVFDTEFSLDTLPFLADHLVFGEVVSPGACQLALTLSAAELLSAQKNEIEKTLNITLEDIILPQALVLAKAETRTVQTILSPATVNDRGPRYDFKVISFDTFSIEENMTPNTHAIGSLAFTVNAINDAVSGNENNTIDAIQRRCIQAVDIAAYYTSVAQAQIMLGPSFQWMQALWCGEDDESAEALARLVIPAGISTKGYLLHPGLLDGCFQTIGGAITANEMGETMLPFALESLQLYRPVHGDNTQTSWWCHAKQHTANKWDIRLMDEHGVVVAMIEGFQLRAASAEAVHGDDLWKEWLYEVDWRKQSYFGLAPTYLPDPTTLISSLRESAPILWAELVDDTSQTIFDQLESLSVNYILATFAKAGFTLPPGTTWRLEEIIRQIGVIPTYHRLLTRLLAILTDAGILQLDGERWLVMKSTNGVDPTIRSVEDEQTIETTAELALLHRCGDKLGEVLRGLQDPLELLFPDGNDTTVTQLYAESGPSVVMNRLIQQTVQMMVDALPPTQGIRIVEIGAGTGSTTQSILPLLPTEQTDYLFTDIGPVFLSKAQERFEEYTFVRYQTLDIEQSPTNQGCLAYGADLVLAANVLHATKDLDETLTNVRQLLQPGGQLVLLEGTQSSAFVDLTFGLTDGWWRFDDDYREQYPLLDVQRWQTLLLAHGFETVTFVEEGGQAVIVAQYTSNWDHVPTQEQTVVSPWLIFGDTQGVGAALAEQLKRRGERPVLIHVGDVYQQIDDQTIQIRPDHAEDYQQLLRLFADTKQIVHLWSLDTPEAPAHLEANTNLVEASQLGYGTVLHLVQTLIEVQVEPTRLWLVTSQTQAVTATDSVLGVVQSGLWGMGKVVALEHPELHPTCIDLDGTSSIATQASWLMAEMMDEPTQQEPQVALRQDGRYLARLGRYEQTALLVPEGSYRLGVDERGTLDNLQLNAVERHPLGSNEVEIAVQASGINFRDVLNVLGMYPGDPGPIGGECAGVIVAVGENVTEFNIGDEVMTTAIGGMGQYAIAQSSFVAHKPAVISMTEAATIPIAFGTAYYGLHKLAKMKAGDRVLIHTATGGVGMAAVQLAQRVGAEVYGTASPGKWTLLRSMGVTHIYNSRTTDFAEQILADTNGEGVNIILNSVTGPGFIEANLSVLALGGYMAEMSKRDIWSTEQVAAVRPDVVYMPFDLNEVWYREPTLAREMLSTFSTLLATEELRPLPNISFPMEQAVSAFRYMQQAKHTGKIVLTPPTAHVQRIQPDATYLITGGLGGLGLAVAEWMVDEGAKHLLLMGRSQPKPAVQPQLDALVEKGVVVTIAQGDVTQLGDVEAALAQVDSRYPLRGIIHSVGVLDDGALLQQDWVRFARVLAPKMQGAWHLHTLTQEMPLDFFVLFSSIAGLLGNLGQANHASANAFLDAFVSYRRAINLPAMSINWGAWSKIGAAAELVRNQGQQMRAAGQHVISPKQGIAALAYLLQQSRPQVGVIPIEWTQFLQNVTTINPFLADFVQDAESFGVETANLSSTNLRQQLAEAEAEERKTLLLDFIRTTVAKVLGFANPQHIDPRQGLMDMGLDSLMAVEVRNQLSRSLECSLPSTLIFDYPTSERIQHYLLTELFTSILEMDDEIIDENVVEDARADIETVLVSDEVAMLSADDLMAQIAADFETIG